jgi:hypothetical protein
LKVRLVAPIRTTSALYGTKDIRREPWIITQSEHSPTYEVTTSSETPALDVARIEVKKLIIDTGRMIASVNVNSHIGLKDRIADIPELISLLT